VAKDLLKGIYPSPLLVKGESPLSAEDLSSCDSPPPRRVRGLGLLDPAYAFLPQNLGGVSHPASGKALRRLQRLSSCGVVGHLSFGWVSAGEEEYPAVRFHPHRCRSVFCEDCWSARVRQNNRRLDFFFRWLRDEGVSEVYFLTLTVPHEGWDLSVVDRLRSAWRRLWKLRLSKRLLRELASRVWEVSHEHYSRLLARGVSEEEAEAKVSRLRKEALDFLRTSGGKFVSHVLGVGVRVMEVVVRRGEDGVLTAHPHYHVVLTRPVPLYAMRVLWEWVGGGPILFIEKVRGLRRLRRYLREYLEGGYLDIEGVEFRPEEAVGLEAMLYGVHFVELFGVRYRRPREEGGCPYRYRMEGFVRRETARVVGSLLRGRVLIVSFRRRSWLFFLLCSSLWVSVSEELRREVEERFYLQEAESLRGWSESSEEFAGEDEVLELLSDF